MKKKIEKNELYVCRESLKESKTVFFYSSIKTEVVLFFIHMYVYIIYIHIYKKLRPNQKKLQEQKAFYFQFYILCVKCKFPENRIINKNIYKICKRPP